MCDEVRVYLCRQEQGQSGCSGRVVLTSVCVSDSVCVWPHLKLNRLVCGQHCVSQTVCKCVWPSECVLFLRLCDIGIPSRSENDGDS